MVSAALKYDRHKNMTIRKYEKREKSAITQDCVYIKNKEVECRVVMMHIEIQLHFLSSYWTKFETEIEKKIETQRASTLSEFLK